MSKFFSGFGIRSGGEGAANVVGNAVPNNEHLHDDPRYRDYYKAKKESMKGPSKSFGAEGEHINFGKMGRGGYVLHEEFNQHTARVEQIVAASSQSDSGTYRVEYETTAPGQLTQVGVKKIHE